MHLQQFYVDNIPNSISLSFNIVGLFSLYGGSLSSANATNSVYDGLNPPSSVRFSPPWLHFLYFWKVTFLQWLKIENPASPVALPPHPVSLMATSRSVSTSYFLFSAAWTRFLEESPHDFTTQPKTLLYHCGLVWSHSGPHRKFTLTTREPMFTVSKHGYLFVPFLIWFLFVLSFHPFLLCPKCVGHNYCSAFKILGYPAPVSKRYRKFVSRVVRLRTL